MVTNQLANRSRLAFTAKKSNEGSQRDEDMRDRRMKQAKLKLAKAQAAQAKLENPDTADTVTTAKKPRPLT